MKKNYSSRSLIRQGMRYLCRALDKGVPCSKMRENLRRFVNRYEGLKRNERSLLYRELYDLYRSSKNYLGGDWQRKLGQCQSYDKIVKAARRVEREKKLRDKQLGIRAMLQDNETIFFLCTVHDHCADDHKMWQGLIYVDRFWRTKIEGELYYPVLSYIKNRRIRTVQWVMGEPVWMTTRPNCKHYFIPLKTEEVLHSSPKILNERHRYKTYSRDDYYELRRAVYTDLDEISPCSYFKKIKRG